MELSAELTGKMSKESHPNIMVDKILTFNASNRTLTACKFISLNEPVFEGHFPDLKLWPGIYTLNGLRQVCNLLQLILELDRKNLTRGLYELEKLLLYGTTSDPTLCATTLQAIEGYETPPSSKIIYRVKLLMPVFAGCIMNYQVQGSAKAGELWKVSALVEGKRVANGTIVLN